MGNLSCTSQHFPCWCPIFTGQFPRLLHIYLILITVPHAHRPMAIEHIIQILIEYLQGYTTSPLSFPVGLLAKYWLCYLARVFSVVLCHISEQRWKRSPLTGTCGPRFLSLLCVSQAALSTSPKGLLGLLLFTPTTMPCVPLSQTRKLRHRGVKRCT